MPIIPKSKAEGFIRAAFGESGENRPKESEADNGYRAWSLPQATPQSDQALPKEPSPPPISAPQTSPAPPIFEIPEGILQSLYEQAVLQGLEEGKGQVFAELTVLQERYLTAIEQLNAVSLELQSRNQLQLITLSCRIAERLLRDELKVRPERLMQMISEALAGLEERDEVLIRCSQEDHTFLSERRDELASDTGGIFSIRIQADPSLEYGDFKLETQHASTDGRLAQRIAQIEAILLGGR